MTDSRERAAGLAQKLLRTAAPSSGASENERTTAALHAADLIEKHELTIVAAEPEQERKARERAERRARRAAVVYASAVHTPDERDFHEVVAKEPYPCSACGRTIRPGELTWFAEGRGHIHHDIDCSLNR